MQIKYIFHIIYPPRASSLVPGTHISVKSLLKEHVSDSI